MKLEEVNFSVVKEAATLVNLYDSGQVDFALLNGEFVDKYRSKKDEFGTYSQVSTYFIRMNQKRDGQDTPLKSKNYVKQLRYQLIKEFSKCNFK